MTKIDNLFDIEVKSLGFETTIRTWCKNEAGYSLSRYCDETKDSLCKSRWIVKINVPSGVAKLFFKQNSKHLNVC